MIIEIVALFFGVFAWWLIFGTSCYMNGGPMPFDWSTPFRGLGQDFSFNLPGGWHRRLQATKGDVEWAKAFPGWWHIWTMHFCVPFGPLMFFRFLRDFL